MPNLITWDTAGGLARTQVLSTELNALASGSYSAAGTTVNNDTTLARFLTAELNVTYGSAPTANGYCALYLVYSQDGTNFQDGGGAVAPPVTNFVGYFPLRAVTTAQRVFLNGGEPVPVQPFDFKPVLLNAAGQAMPASGSTLHVSTFNEEVQ